MKLLYVSTPVGALGTGLGGGVELTLYNAARALIALGHTVEIIAPQGSHLPDLPVIEIPGNLQPTAQTQGRDAPIVLPENAVLTNLWDYARSVQAEFDLIVNFAYDWLPFYLSAFFTTPIAHLVSMGSMTDAMDQAIGQVFAHTPATIAFHTYAQAATFPFIAALTPADQATVRCLGNGIDLDLYQFCPQPGNFLAWVGRIAPEKGLEDAIAAVAQMTSQPAPISLKIFGAIQDPDYWADVRSRFPDAPIAYAGFLPTQELQAALGQAQALLMTPHWVEAFGNVVIEALACGVPAIAYRRGGPAEIVRDGQTGFLVEPEFVPGLVAAIARIGELDRQACRVQAEQEYSIPAMGERLQAWFQAILAS